MAVAVTVTVAVAVAVLTILGAHKFERVDDRTQSVTEFRMLGAALTKTEVLLSVPKRVRTWLGLSR